MHTEGLLKLFSPALNTVSQPFFLASTHNGHIENTISRFNITILDLTV